MYNIGDLIIYSGEGVCRVEEIGIPQISGANKEKKYYTLSPLYRNGKVFTPVEGNVFMRPVISREEAVELIRKMPETEAEVCENRNLRFLSEHYQECIRTHDCIELVKVIKAVYQKRLNANVRGKKLGQIDERFLKRAEDMLYGELAVALDVPRPEVPAYITAAIEKMEAGEDWNG